MVGSLDGGAHYRHHLISTNVRFNPTQKAMLRRSEGPVSALIDRAPDFEAVNDAPAANGNKSAVCEFMHRAAKVGFHPSRRLRRFR
jgi:hypothetical protein